MYVRIYVCVSSRKEMNHQRECVYAHSEVQQHSHKCEGRYVGPRWCIQQKHGRRTWIPYSQKVRGPCLPPPPGPYTHILLCTYIHTYESILRRNDKKCNGVNLHPLYCRPTHTSCTQPIHTYLPSKFTHKMTEKIYTYANTAAPNHTTAETGA